MKYNLFLLLAPICNQCVGCCLHDARNGLQIRASGYLHEWEYQKFDTLFFTYKNYHAENVYSCIVPV